MIMCFVHCRDLLLHLNKFKHHIFVSCSRDLVHSLLSQSYLVIIIVKIYWLYWLHVCSKLLMQ